MASNDNRDTTFLLRLRVSLNCAYRRLLAPLTLTLYVGAAFVAALAGPFGSYGTEGFGLLFVTWLLLIAAAMFIIFGLYAFWATILREQETLGFNLLFIPTGALASALCIDAFLTHLFAYGPATRPSLMELAVYVGAIMLVVVLVRFFVPELQMGAGARARETSVQMAANRLARRLELPHGARILHIAASGHFIDIRSCAQTHRIRMRFSDAVLELDEAVGLMTHRSHWVLREAVRGWVNQGSKPVVVLHDGSQVPVSKTYLAQVEAAQLRVLDPDDTELALSD